MGCSATAIDKSSAPGLIGAMHRSLAALFALMFGSPALAMTGNAPSAAGPRHEVLIVGSHGTSCTGTAIAPDLVLTAGHCIEAGTTYKVVQFDAARQPQLLDVREVARHPQFDLRSVFAHRATADVALLKMVRPLPADIVPATLATSAALQIGDTLTVVGYGLAIRGDGRSGGTLRAARLAVTGKPGNLQIRLVDPATGGKRAGLGACTGDSGAPAYAGTAMIGVVSWSTGPNLTDGCGGLTGVTPLSLYRAWIVETARKLGSPLAP
jgi:secreted trypsin-like serine protease